MIFFSALNIGDGAILVKTGSMTDMQNQLVDKYLRQHNIAGFSDYPGIREALMETEAFREFLRREWLARHPIIAKILKAVGAK